MKKNLNRCGALRRRQEREVDQKRKSPNKTRPIRFDALVARYYDSIYDLVLQITGDPLEALFLTHDASIEPESNYEIVAMTLQLCECS